MIDGVQRVLGHKRVRLAQMGIEDPNSHSGYRTRALGRQAQSQQRDRGDVEDRE